MDLSVVTHFCRHELSASKISFSGKPVSCGMKGMQEGHVDHFWANGFHADSNCCTNHVYKLTVDHNYSPSFFAFKHFGHQLLQVFVVPENLINHSYTALTVFCTNVLPPGMLKISNVSLSDICVFRI